MVITLRFNITQNIVTVLFMALEESTYSIRIYIYTHTHAHIHMYINTYMHIHIHIFTFIFTSMYTNF